MITPVVLPGIVPYREPEHRKLYLYGLRLAAGEATRDDATWVPKGRVTGTGGKWR